MARGKVFIEDENGIRLWRTDLTGHGNVYEGNEFTIRELEQYGGERLVKDGIKRRVRVVEVDQRSRSFHVLKVEILEDLSPQKEKTLFD